MKKFLLFFAVLFLGISSLSGQKNNRPWVIQVSAGYSDTENIPGSFTYGFYLGKRIGNIFEVGISMHNATRQGSRNTHSYASNAGEVVIQDNFSSSGDDEWMFYDAGSANCYMAVAGVRPLSMLFEKSKHELLIAAQVGLSNKHNIHYVYNGVDRGTVNLYANSETHLGYGGRISYEYNIYNAVGIGGTVIYDRGNRMLTAMVALTAHF